MNRPALRSALFSVLGLALFLVAPSARADAKTEAAATGLQKKAMDDYIATDFAKAQDKLNKAINQCGEAKCGPGLRARLLRDLGVIQIGGALGKEKGIQSFVDAIKIDPGVALDPDIKTKDLDAAFAEAKKRANGGGGDEPAPKPKRKPVAEGQPEGDFTHAPTPVQQVRTPIPVYVEYNGEQGLSRVVARYKGFGMPDWKNVDLKKMGEKGWGGLIPCENVQQGVTQYILTGFDSNNDPVAQGGDRNNPYKVQITNDKPDDAPHLPQQAPPAQCQDAGSDCPPDFPGCKKPKGPVVSDQSEAKGKDGGEVCEEDAECKSQSCSGGKCADAESGGSSDSSKAPRFWIGVTGQIEMNFIPTVEDACKLGADAYPLNQENYYCVTKDGTDYPVRPPTSGDSGPAKAANDAIVSSANRGSDKVAGGGAFGNIRILLSADYALTGNIMIGVRVGLVLNNYPGEAAGQDGKRFSAPIHLEGRFTYVAGLVHKEPLFQKGFNSLALYAMAGGGVAPFETQVGVQTIEAVSGAAQKHQVDAWHIAGPGFVGFGGGLRVAPHKHFALMFGPRLDFAFGNSFIPSLGGELNAAVGF